VLGARGVEYVEEIVDEAKRRTGRRVLRLVTCNACPTYETAILSV
jgi:hypothetical protein